MAANQAIFPTFFMSGFECSSFEWGERGRRDLNAELQHYEHADEDYRFIASLGLGVAREGIPWPLVDKGGEYDFSIIDDFLAAQRRRQVLPIWDLCHYGFPSDIDPWSDEFVRRFAAYAKAAARYVAERAHHGPLCFTPVNEPPFWGYMGGEWGWCAPFGKSADDRRRFTLQLAKADIAAVTAIRQDFPDARMVHIDPLIWVVPPKNRPDLAGEAHRESFEDAYIAWDVISGLKHPELGGSPEVIDILGFNNYSFGQMEYAGGGKPNVPLQPGDDRIRPLCELLVEAWAKYKRPSIIAETSGLHGGRPGWLNDLMCESLAAVRQGMDLQGICLFPAVCMTDWHKGDWLHRGLADVGPLPSGALMRKPFLPYLQMLERWQKRLKRVTSLDEDPFDSSVDLADIREAAEQLRTAPDADWH